MKTFASIQRPKIKALVTASVLAFAFQGALPAQAQEFMTKSELLATIPGSQVSGIANSDGKTRWVQAYSQASRKNDGLLNGLWGKDKYAGQWYIKGDQWCEKGDWGEGCWSMERLGPKEIRVYKDGKALKNTWKLK